MKSTLIFVLLFISTLGFSQEICDNGIDDDGDLLIDLNDDECDCGGIVEEIGSLIPNPSFEEMLCCPDFLAQLDCAADWDQASSATSDYYNSCDFYGPSIVDGAYLDPMLPLPGGGDGYVGFISNAASYMEYIGVELLSPMLAGTEYTLHLYTARSRGYLDLEFSLYGTPTALDLPWGSLSCPIGDGDWELLATEFITYAPDASWMEVILTYTPAVDINAIAIGGPCVPFMDNELGINNYYFVDGLTLIDSDHFAGIVEIGDWCDGDLSLEASIDTTGGIWQWYKEGIALVGETDETVDVMLYGEGDYTAVYYFDDDCTRKDYSVIIGGLVAADFDFSAACVGDPILFTNSSIIAEGITPGWEWDFGDGGDSDEEDPSHTYATSGIFTVELIVLNDVGCNDTIEIDVTVDPPPNANFEFLINEISSQDGLSGGCVDNEVLFNDLSTAIDPDIIVDWYWDFGDGTDSDLENPTHMYGAAGTYTVTLVVTTEAGCSHSFSLDIIMTNGLSIELLVNQPTCFGFSDGSLTVNVLGGGDELVFIISDADGTVLNEDNSNTANTLTTGWYYVDVSDGSSCDAIDSLFIGEPDQLAIDITITDPLCYGFETGWARVDAVYNATGDIDNVSYFWNPNPGNVEGVFADSTNNLGAGNYTLTINDDNGCSMVFDFEVEQPDSIFFSEFGFEPAFCRLYGYQSGNGVVYGAASGGTPDFDYLWTHIETGDTYLNTTWGGINPGNYELTVTDANGCVLKGAVTLDSLNPIADFTVASDQLNTDLKGTAPVEAYFTNTSENFSNSNNPAADTTFFWNLNRPIADWQVTHDYFEIFDTIYAAQGQSYTVDVCLVAINKNGCTDTACRIITIFEPIVFTQINTFTPNGDGINDVFSFDFRSASISEFSCVIVNRWGIVVFEMDDITDAWDGTNKGGDLCKDGTYFYTYAAITDNGTALKGQGNISLFSGQ